MTFFTNRAVDVFAPTDGSGNARGASMAETQAWGIQVERALAGYGDTSSVTGDATVADTDSGKLFLADASGAGFTITLPAAATVGNDFRISVKKTDATYKIVTIDGSASETIDGSATLPLTFPGQVVTIQSDGTNWQVVSRHLEPVAVTGSGGFYSNHSVLDGSRNDAIFHRLGDRVLVGAAVVDTGELNRIDRQLSSLTRSGTTATATTTDPHGFTTGVTHRVSQVAETEYNGDVTITVTGPNTFTYEVSGSPTTPASPETDKIMKVSTIPAGTQDPMETGRWGTTRLAQMAVGATDGNIGILAYSFASTGAAGGDLGTIAFAAYAVNDTTDGDIVYAGYFEAIRKPGAGISQGIEVNSANEGSVVDMTPHNPSVAGASIGIWAASGGEQATKEFVLQDSTVAAAIVYNGAAWKRGLIIADNAIASNGSAIAMSSNAAHEIAWFAGTFGSVSSKIGFIRSTATTATYATSISLTDDGCAVQDLSGANTLFLVAGSASTVNGFKASAGTTGNGPQLEAVGSDTNINLHLAPKGTGLVKAAKGFDITVATDDRSILVHDDTYGIRTFHSASGSHLEGVDDTGAASYEPLFVGGLTLALQVEGVTRILANGTGLGFFGATPIAKPTVTGSRGGNAALASLLTQLSSLGLCTDSTS